MIKKLGLNRKIRESKKYIREFYNYLDGLVYISFSGGKDSTVLRHLIKSMYLDVPVVFCNTTNEKKEIYDYVKLHKDTIWLLPKKGFVWCLKNHGFPMVSKKVCRKVKDLKKPTKENAKSRSNWNNPKSAFRLANKWRFLLDEDFRRYQRETKRKPFTGVMGEESQQRERNIIQNGVNILKGKNIKSNPLAFWTENDIWLYAELYNIRFAENYYNRIINDIVIPADKRSGCKVCLMGYGFECNKNEMTRLDKLRILEPKSLNKLLQIKNNNTTLKQAIVKTFILKG